MVSFAGADKPVDVMSCDTPWQLGNAAYPLANDLLGKVVDETKAFRNVYDIQWKERVGDIMECDEDLTIENACAET